MTEKIIECLNRPVLPDDFYPVPRIQKYTYLGFIRDFSKGSAVVLPGESTCKMIYILSGQFRVNMVTEDGNETLIYIAGPHTLLGRLFASNINDFHIVAMIDSVVCFFTKEQLRDIFRQDEEIIFEVMKNYTSKVSYFMQKIKYLDTHSPTVRILRLLEDLCYAKGKLVGDTYQIKTALSQKNIAEITGAHYVTVSKVFSFLKKQGIAHKTKNIIYIYDLQKLEELIKEPVYQ